MWYHTVYLLVYTTVIIVVLSEAHLSDKWDENVRPKMVYSYLQDDQPVQSKPNFVNIYDIMSGIITVTQI